MTEQQLNKFIKIYNRLLPSLKRIYNNYIYLDLSPEKFENLIKSFLEDIYIKNNEVDNNDDFYLKKLKIYLNSYVKMNLKEPTEGLKIINCYINKKIITELNNKDEITKLKKLANFLEKYEYIPSPDNCLELIKTNEFLSSIIKTIIDTKLEL